MPHPAQFAVHKLLIAKRRAAAFHTKREKDLGQAAHVIGVALLEARHPAAYGAVRGYT